MVVMNIANKKIELLDFSKLEELHSLTISNCTISTINFDLFEPNFQIKIEDCKIENFLIHSCWFKGGLLFRNNEVTNYIDYQMGGHNELPIILEGNIFNSFVNFFDCHFYAQLEVLNNSFIKGSNLLGNLQEGFKNTFGESPIFKNNIGDIDIDGFGL
jgi:hypothetical protein